MKNKINREIQVLARYLGCKCDIDYAPYVLRLQKNTEFSASKISDYSKGYIRELTLRLKPVSELTQEDYERMEKELGIKIQNGLEGYQIALNNLEFRFQEADWLRSNGYYLGEPEIKEFVK